MRRSKTDAARALCAIAAAMTVATTAVSAVGETLPAVLARAGDYVLSFERRLAGIVAEEHYLQVVHPAVRFNRDGRPVQQDDIRRALESDLLLVRPQGVSMWIQFRDVFEVDGKPVRDRNDRLMKLFLQPSRSTADQARRIVDDSTRIRTNDRRDLPARGRFWIEPSTGRVLMSELVAAHADISGRIDVSYQSEPLVGLLVPIEMHEEYRGRWDGATIEGTATCTNFRQFQVKADEQIGPITEKPDRR